MAHEASTENIVVRVLYRADHGDPAATSETNDRLNAENMHGEPRKPAWSQKRSPAKIAVAFQTTPTDRNS